MALVPVSRIYASARRLDGRDILESAEMNKQTALLRLLKLLANPTPRKALRFGIVILVGCSACQKPVIPEVRSGYLVAARCPSPDSDEFYLAPDRLSYGAEGDKRLRESLSRLFKEASLAPLWCGSGVEEAYRVVWLPSSGPALVVHLSLSATGWKADSVSFGHPPQVEPKGVYRSTIIQRGRINVAAESAMSAVTKLREAGFWSVPTLRVEDAAGNDGADLIIEGRKDRSYQIVRHWQPNDEPLGRAARIIIEIGGGQIPSELRD